MPKNLKFISITVLTCLFALEAKTKTLYIDRKISLQSGTEYYLALGYVFHPMPSNKEQVSFVYDLEAKQALDEDYNLIWSPLPLGLQFYLPSGPDVESAVSWRIGLLDWGRPGIKPEFGSYFRRRMNSKTAIETHLKYFLFMPSGKETFSSINFTIGPLFQISDSFAISPTFGIAVNDSLMRAVFIDEFQEKAAFPTHFPLGVVANFQVADNYNIGFDYSYRNLFNLEDRFTVHILQVYASWLW